MPDWNVPFSWALMVNEPSGFSVLGRGRKGATGFIWTLMNGHESLISMR